MYLRSDVLKYKRLTQSILSTTKEFLFKMESSGMNNRKIMEEIRIPVPYGHISGIWWGPKKNRPVLALHGWQDNAGTWDTLMPLLAPDISVLAIDLPGHGMSSHYPPGQIYHLFWDGVYVIRRIAKHYSWKKVTLLGHSLGGGISFLYAGVFPDHVDKLISIDIISPTIREPSESAEKSSVTIDQLLKYENLSEDSIPCYEYEEMIDIVEDAYKGSVTRTSCKILMKRGMAPAKNGKGFHFSRDVRLKAAGISVLSEDLIIEFAKRIRCNVLNIKAKPGMAFDNPKYYPMILNILMKKCHVEYYEIEGTHHLHLNTPEKVNDIISKFILQPIKDIEKTD